MTDSGSSQPNGCLGVPNPIPAARWIVRIYPNRQSHHSQQSRFSVSNRPFRDNAIGNRFWENGSNLSASETEHAFAVPLNLLFWER